jgi:hypothetical protein
MASLSDFEFLPIEVPGLDKVSSLIEEEDDELRGESLLVIARLLSLVSNMPERELTGERLAWYSVCLKALRIVNSARVAYDATDEWILSVGSRSILELQLEVECFLEPITGQSDRHEKAGSTIPMPKELRQRGVIDRLRAYAAWCLWSDRSFYKEMSHHRALHDAWSAQGPSDLDLPGNADLKGHMEDVFGKMKPDLPDHELVRGRESQRRHLEEQLERIDDWLAHDHLSHWRNRLRDESPNSYFRLVNRSGTRGELEKNEMRFAYSVYMRGSMGLHGSTVDQLFAIDGSHVIPKLEKNDSDAAPDFDFINGSAKHIHYMLTLMDQTILSQPHLRR